MCVICRHNNQTFLLGSLTKCIVQPNDYLSKILRLKWRLFYFYPRLLFVNFWAHNNLEFRPGRAKLWTQITEPSEKVRREGSVPFLTNLRD